ncbi:unnamed protein product, partial [Didymodactylos carnosus]
FNIVRFGSGYKTLFNNITDIYNEKNAKQAEQLISHIKADLGGTELLQPLQWLEKQATTVSYSRQIFLLTDGEISNVNEVIDPCRSMSTSARIFSFGLGHSPSRSLVKGLARSTYGRFTFVPPGTSVDIHVAEQLQKVLESEETVRLGLARINHVPETDNGQSITRLVVKTLIREFPHAKQEKTPNCGSQQARFQQQQEQKGGSVEDGNKKRMIDISLQHNLLCPHTGFIGVETHTDPSAKNQNANMVLREIPIEITADDKHFDVPFVGGAAPQRMLNSSVQSPVSNTTCFEATYFRYCSSPIE